MDELDMMSLELPSTESLDDTDNPETANSAPVSVSGDYNEDDFSYEYEGGELEDMAVPVLSEMDGSVSGTPAENAAAKAAAAKSVSLDKPKTDSVGSVGLSEMSGAPAFSEMSGAPAGGQSRQYGGQGMNGQGMNGQGMNGQGMNGQGMNGQYGSNASGNNFGNNANNSSYNSPNNMQYQQGQQGGYGRQNTYAPVNSGSSNGGRTDYWDLMDQDLPMVQRGAKIAKVIATIIIVISALDIILGLLVGAFRTVVAAGYRIYFSTRLKNGSHNSRYWLGIGCVLSVIFNLISMFEISGWSGAVAEAVGSAWIISVIEAIILVPTVGFGIMAYFLLLDKSVEAFCERSGGRGDL